MIPDFTFHNSPRFSSAPHFGGRSLFTLAVALVLVVAILVQHAEARTRLLISARLKPGTIGRSYQGTVTASRGRTPYRYLIISGQLPPGLVLKSSTGLISGTPTHTGTYNFTIKATDRPLPSTGKAHLSITVLATTQRVTVAITPASATLSSGQQQQFTALVTNTSNTAVTWSTTQGSISNKGLFIAPSATSAKTATVSATSASNSAAYATATVTITAASQNPPPPPSPPTPNPPPAPKNPPPPGPSPSPAGADNRYCAAGDVAKFGTQDGPASLPQQCINTALVNTPSLGNTITVSSSLQTAVDNAQCGDTIQLQAGATFGSLTLPAKNCDARHWITIRTSTPNASLPPEGARLTPCYAGVAALPGRPSYSCGNKPATLTAQIAAPTGGHAITSAPGASYYRFIGLEVTRPNNATSFYALIKFGAGSHHIIFDRMWVHGNAMAETVRGVFLSGTTNVAVIDSTFTDFHCIAGTGACTDAQAIAGGTGGNQDGVYKIVNNFLEGAAETILFGGAGGSTVPADMEIRRNHMFKPLFWNPSDPSFSGPTFIVKNLFELKNGRRILFEGNILENTWGGFTQTGAGIVLTPRNQGGSLCPLCAVTDVTLRWNRVTHTGRAFGLSTAAGAEGHNFSIHDNVFDDMNYPGCQGCKADSLVVIGGSQWILHDVAINHNTIVTGAPMNAFLVIGGTPTYNMQVSNNIGVAGAYEVIRPGNSTDCSIGATTPSASITQCWGNASWFNNLLIGATGIWPPTTFYSQLSSVGFTNLNGGMRANYQLLGTSPYAHAGTDGKDLGADTTAVATSIAGVY